jgi:hypothetical protein
MPNGNGFFGGDASPWRDWLEEDPLGQRAAYFSFAPQFGQSAVQRRYYENAFPRIRDEWLGQLGREARGADVNGAGSGRPTTRFVDYLGAFKFPQSRSLRTAEGRMGAWPGAEYYTAQPPGLRGTRASQYAPRTRRLIY